MSESTPPSIATRRLPLESGIDDAVYGLMMILDGVSGGLANQQIRVKLRTKIELIDRNSEQMISEVNLAEGDGMCMGYHGWREGNFGTHPILESE